MYKYIVFILFSFLCNLNIFAQSNKVVAGPMMSFVDSYGTQIWFLLNSDTERINIDVSDYDSDKVLKYAFEVVNPFNLEEFPYTVLLDDLRPDKEYIVSIYVDSVLVKEIDLFTETSHLDDLQFLIGHDLTGTDESILTYMSETNSDFMMWLGGHVDLESEMTFEDMLVEYINVRKKEKLNNFLVSMPQIATWSILDYGFSNPPNSLEEKELIYSVFDLFWPNTIHKTYNYTFDDYGTYQRYTYNDVDIFLLDAQTFKSDHSLYGDKQIERLFQEIGNTGASFTILASPAPFISSSEKSFSNYQDEFQHFMEKLKTHNKNGLFLISIGSENEPRLFHHRLDEKSSFIYEFTLPVFGSNNYSMISLKGPKKNRIMSFETYNKNGNLLYRRNFDQNQLTN